MMGSEGGIAPMNALYKRTIVTTLGLLIGILLALTIGRTQVYSTLTVVTRTGDDWTLRLVDPTRDLPYDLINRSGENTFRLWLTERELDMLGDGTQESSTATYPIESLQWSPDGSSLIFVANQDGNAEIYLLETASGAIRNLTQSEHEDTEPSWSPDGNSLVFASRRTGNWEIFVLNLANDSLHQLTNDSLNNQHPAWSPDGRQIAFVSRQAGFSELQILDLDTGQIQTVETGAYPFGFVWNPSSG
jgi:dipeptidyl aminopeptidase/acylaminoacyl peptidase